MANRDNMYCYSLWNLCNISTEYDNSARSPEAMKIPFSSKKTNYLLNSSIKFVQPFLLAVTEFLILHCVSIYFYTSFYAIIYRRILLAKSKNTVKWIVTIVLKRNSHVKTRERFVYCIFYLVILFISGKPIYLIYLKDYRLHILFI